VSYRVETRADPAAVARQVAGQQISFWEAAGRPVCLVAQSQPSAGMARIGPVYTPTRNGVEGMPPRA
jgi:hypothetical protein